MKKSKKKISLLTDPLPSMTDSIHPDIDVKVIIRNTSNINNAIISLDEINEDSLSPPKFSFFTSLPIL